MLDVGDGGSADGDGFGSACTERVAIAGGGLHEAPSDIAGIDDGASGGLPTGGDKACSGRSLIRLTPGGDSPSEGMYRLPSDGASGYGTDPVPSIAASTELSGRCGVEGIRDMDRAGIGSRVVLPVERKASAGIAEVTDAAPLDAVAAGGAEPFVSVSLNEDAAGAWADTGAVKAAWADAGFVAEAWAAVGAAAGG